MSKAFGTGSFGLLRFEGVLGAGAAALFATLEPIIRNAAEPAIFMNYTSVAATATPLGWLWVSALGDSSMTVESTDVGDVGQGVSGILVNDWGSFVQGFETEQSVYGVLGGRATIPATGGAVTVTVPKLWDDAIILATFSAPEAFSYTVGTVEPWIPSDLRTDTSFVIRAFDSTGVEPDANPGATIDWLVINDTARFTNLEYVVS